MQDVTDPAGKAASTYNAAADHFDDEPLGFWARFGRRTVERLALRAGGAVLDVGCGTGASAIPAAERVGPSGRVIGVALRLQQAPARRHHRCPQPSSVDVNASTSTSTSAVPRAPTRVRRRRPDGGPGRSARPPAPAPATW